MSDQQDSNAIFKLSAVQVEQQAQLVFATTDDDNAKELARMTLALVYLRDRDLDQVLELAYEVASVKQALRSMGVHLPPSRLREVNVFDPMSTAAGVSPDE